MFQKIHHPNIIVQPLYQKQINKVVKYRQKQSQYKIIQIYRNQKSLSHRLFIENPNNDVYNLSKYFD